MDVALYGHNYGTKPICVAGSVGTGGGVALTLVVRHFNVS